MRAIAACVERRLTDCWEPAVEWKRHTDMRIHTRLLLGVLVPVALMLVACGEETSVLESTTGEDGATTDSPREETAPLDPIAADTPLLLAVDSSVGVELFAGIISHRRGCVVLDAVSRGEYAIAWPDARSSWDDSTSSVRFGAAAGPVMLGDGTRVTLTGQPIDDPAAVNWAIPPQDSCLVGPIWHVADVVDLFLPNTDPAGGGGPIGGGRASGTGTAVELVCPDVVSSETTEWFGPTNLTTRGALAEGFGDLFVGTLGDPFEIETTEAWATWGVNDSAGNLIAALTLVAENGGWDPSHAVYCDIQPILPPAPPFTLYVSNQSFDDPMVGIEITIDGVEVVAAVFDVEGQHNWFAFTPDVSAGVHDLHAVSDTGVDFTATFSTKDGEPMWAVLDYWFYPDEGPRNFTFDTSDKPLVFG